MDKPIVIECRNKYLGDISLIKVIACIYKYMQDDESKYIINLPYNLFTEKTMEIVKDHILEKECVMYINLYENEWDVNNESKQMMKSMENKHIKKLILENSKDLERLNKWELPKEKLVLMKDNHKKFYDNYSELNACMIISSDKYNIVMLEEFELCKYSYYYCKHCYLSVINEEDFIKHCYFCDKQKSGQQYCRYLYGIKKITDEKIPNMKILNKIMESNYISKPEKLHRYFEYTDEQISKYIFDKLSEIWINMKKIQMER